MAVKKRKNREKTKENEEDAKRNKNRGFSLFFQQLVSSKREKRNYKGFLYGVNTEWNWIFPR